MIGVSPEMLNWSEIITSLGIFSMRCAIWWSSLLLKHTASLQEFSLTLEKSRLLNPVRLGHASQLPSSCFRHQSRVILRERYAFEAQVDVVLYPSLQSSHRDEAALLPVPRKVTVE